MWTFLLCYAKKKQKNPANHGSMFWEHKKLVCQWSQAFTSLLFIFLSRMPTQSNHHISFWHSLNLYAVVYTAKPSLSPFYSAYFSPGHELDTYEAAIFAQLLKAGRAPLCLLIYSVNIRKINNRASNKDYLLYVFRGNMFCHIRFTHLIHHFTEISDRVSQIKI